MPAYRPDGMDQVFVYMPEEMKERIRDIRQATGAAESSICLALIKSKVSLPELEAVVSKVKNRAGRKKIKKYIMKLRNADV